MKLEVLERKRGFLVGPPGFEPGTSCTPSKRASQAAPRPDESMSYNNPSVKNTLASVPRLSTYIERFTRERQYLKGVTSSTLAWYRFSFRAFGPVLEVEYKTVASFKSAVIQRIEQLQREGRGNSAISINRYLRCFKALLKWCHEEGILNEPIKLSWLREEQKVLATLPEDAVRSLFIWKARARTQIRLHALVCLLLDTGLRISEALGLTRDDLDLENLIVRVRGKGNKHRLVPMSLELRKILWKYISRRAESSNSGMLFSTSHGTRVSKRDVLRDLKVLGHRLGITGVRMSPHTFRHTFAVTFLRNGGDVYVLSRILGHASITTTAGYLRSMGIETLSMAHQKFSPLVGMPRGRG
jgi:integrase/recombinase XerD